MKLLTYTAITAFALSFTNLAKADDHEQTTQSKSPHSVGYQSGAGTLSYKGKDSSNNTIAQSYLYYNYEFSDNFYVEAGLTGAVDLDKWECDRNAQNQWECLNEDKKMLNVEADEFSYNAVVIALKADYDLTKHNTLYGKVGAAFYNYELELDNAVIDDKSGTGLLVEAGWEYRWDNNIGMNVGYQYQDASDVELSTLNIGISYKF